MTLQILVTGAAGKTGLSVVQALAREGAKVRALCRRPEQHTVLQAAGANQVIHGDMREPTVLVQAVENIDRIYHICPNVHPDELLIAERLIAAASRAKVKLLAYHSVLHPHTEKMPHHWQKLRVEEKLFESGLAFAVLQPCAYMQNILAHRDEILNKLTYSVPYSLKTRLSLVDLVDVATIATRILLGDDFQNGIFEICGPQPLSQPDITQALSQHLGKSITPHERPVSEWQEAARSHGLSDYQVATLSSMFGYYDRFSFVGNSRVAESLLERPLNTLADFLQREFES